MAVGFERCSAQIQRAFSSHNNSQQPLPNNDLDIAVEIVKAPPATTILLLLLLLLVPCFTICTTISCRLLSLLLLLLIVAITTTSRKKNILITERIFQKIHKNMHSGNYHTIKLS